MEGRVDGCGHDNVAMSMKMWSGRSINDYDYEHGYGCVCVSWLSG